LPLYNTNTPDALTPTGYGALILNGLAEESIARRSGVAQVLTDSATWRAPRITADPTAIWAAEGEDLLGDGPQLDEVIATPRKLARAVTVSQELAADSNPSAVAEVGRSLARALGSGLDAAFFTSATATATKPGGLPSVTGITTVSGGSFASLSNLDAFTEAVVTVSAARSQVRAFYMNAPTWLAVSKLKTGTGSAQALVPLDGGTPVSPFSLLGVPVFITNDVPARTVWALDTSRALIVVRRDVSVETSTDARFTTDEVVVKAQLRADFAFPVSSGIAKVTFAA